MKYAKPPSCSSKERLSQNVTGKVPAVPSTRQSRNFDHYKLNSALFVGVFALLPLNDLVSVMVLHHRNTVRLRRCLFPRFIVVQRGTARSHDFPKENDSRYLHIRIDSVDDYCYRDNL